MDLPTPRMAVQEKGSNHSHGSRSQVGCQVCRDGEPRTKCLMTCKCGGGEIWGKVLSVGRRWATASLAWGSTELGDPTRGTQTHGGAGVGGASQAWPPA